MTPDYCDHGIYYGWLGRCQDCTSRGNVSVGTQVPGYGVEPRRPRVRDAAMWAAFVHEMRADLYLDELARTIEYAINMQIMAELNESVRATHAAHSDRVLADLRAMTPDQVRQTFVDAGIYDENGNLTEPYR